MKVVKWNFTLIELLVVVSVTLILSSMLLAALDGVHAMHKEVACVNKMRLIGFAHAEYQADHNGEVVPCLNADSGRAFFYDSWYYVLGPYVPDIFQERMIDGSYTGSSAYEYHVPLCPEYEMGTTFRMYGVADPVEVEHTGLMTGGISMNRAFGYYSSSTTAPRKMYRGSMVKKPAETALNLEAYNWTIEPENYGYAWYGARFPHPGGMNVLYFDNHISPLAGQDPYTTPHTDLIWNPDGVR